MFKFNKSSPATQAGQVSRLLLVLAIVVLVAVVITYLIIKMASKPAQPVQPVGPVQQLPVYEKQLGNIDFTFESAINRDDTLNVSDISNPQYSGSYQKDLQVSPGAKFIQVTVGAKNMGTTNTEQNAWDIENVVDSQSREFIPLQDYTVAPWISTSNSCGALLKPAFDPLPCTKIYEVSDESSGLKIRVETGKDNSANNLSSGKSDTFLIDLIVK